MKQHGPTDAHGAGALGAPGAPHDALPRGTPGYVLPDVRRASRHLRSVAATLAAVVVLTAAIAGVTRQVRGVPADVPTVTERALDGRTDGMRAIEYGQKLVAASPDDPRALVTLASAYLYRVRETADPSLYAKADGLLQRALALAPNDADVAMSLGSLANSRHDFAGGLEWGRRAVEAAPARAAAWGVLTDSLVELGRYEEAVAAAQHMVDLRPDLASLSRVSYVRELHGDLDGAIDAMRRAVTAGAPTGEATAWSQVQVGHLLFAKGDLDGALAEYEGASHRIDGYVYATAGKARVKAARGDLVGAAALYEGAAGALPLPEFVIALGDTYARMGDRTRADQQFALVRAMNALFAANGVRTDVDLALFDADHLTDVDGALRAARAEYAVRQSVHVADTLAWAEYRAGLEDDALRHSVEALRLGSQDPLMLYRAGVIAAGGGDTARARSLLMRSAELNARFSLLFADDLASRLAVLGAR
ncbi:MAG: tetratricopeptide repeat protein [Candidatus Limnocylindria bacterium]